jgi:hypothetical protein
MIEEALYNLLKDNAGVSAVVSGRIYPIELPQNCTLPALVYQVVTSLHEESHEGSSGLAASAIEIEAWAETALGARDLGELVRAALQGYAGTKSSVVIHGILDWTSNEILAEDTGFYEHISQATAWHEVTQ